MRLVIDTNIAISGLLWRGAPSRLLELAFTDAHQVYTSPELFDEFCGTLARAKFDRRVALSQTTRSALLESFNAACLFVSPDKLPVSIAPDPDDDWVIATALAAEADLIVTGDKPFLGVGSVGPVRIVTVREALELLS